MSDKAYYVRLISTYDPVDKYGRYLIQLMDKYNKPNLMEITFDEAKEFWEELIKK